jgi:cytoskeletal protein CcmA (bactofilin family)
VEVGQLVLSGNIQGEIVASKKVVLHKTANLVGKLNTPVLVIEEGAVVEGQVTMNSPAAASTSETGKPKSPAAVSPLKSASS